MKWTRGEFEIDTDPQRLSPEVIHGYLQRSYWAPDRPLEKVVRSIQASLNFGVYQGDRQVGFARVVSDFVTFFWLADVFILEEYRGHGLGKWLVETVVGYPDLKGCKGVLATRDAHGLYEQFGFNVPEDPRRYMGHPPL